MALILPEWRVRGWEGILVLPTDGKSLASFKFQDIRSHKVIRSVMGCCVHSPAPSLGHRLTPMAIC